MEGLWSLEEGLHFVAGVQSTSRGQHDNMVHKYEAQCRTLTLIIFPRLHYVQVLITLRNEVPSNIRKILQKNNAENPFQQKMSD